MKNQPLINSHINDYQRIKKNITHFLATETRTNITHFLATEIYEKTNLLQIVVY